jgi:hypothetical protein
MLSKRPLLAVALALAALVQPLAQAESADALRRWPTTQIRVCDHSGYANNVRQAIGWWNRVPSRVHLYQSCRAPHIVIKRYFSRNPNVAGRGQYPPGGLVILNHYWMRQLPPTYRSDTAAHEIGHALGLSHLPPCSLMFGGAGLGENCEAPSGRERCGPQRRDAKELIRRYGGRLGGFRGYTCAAVYS